MRRDGPSGMGFLDKQNHPVTAVLAVVAIVCTILLILWVRMAVQGTEDIEATLLVEPSAMSRYVDARTEQQREVDAAVTSNRFATGLSP